MQDEHQAPRSAQRVEDLGEQLVRAILDHRVIRLRYQGLDRVVEPHLLGIHEAGEPMLIGYQTAGPSRSGDIPGWRTFITTSIEDVELTDERFTMPRSDMNVRSQSMTEIFARA